MEVDGNGIEIYRPVDFESNPGSFSKGSSEYQVVSNDTWAANDAELRSYFDLEPGSGLTVRSRMRFGKSYALWECNPQSNEMCHIGRRGQGERSCYSVSGSGLFTDLGDAKKAELIAAGETSFTFPCSASNVLTPGVVGGKVIPSHWSEEFTPKSYTDDIDFISDWAHNFLNHSSSFYIWFTMSLFLIINALCMMVECFWFEKVFNTVQVAVENQTKIGDSASSTATSNVSAVSSASVKEGSSVES